MSRRKKTKFNDPTNITSKYNVCDMVKNLIPSVFQWYGLPHELGISPSSEVFEKLLNRHNIMALFNTTVGYQILPAYGGNVDQWGEFSPYGLNPIIIGTSNPIYHIVKRNDFIPIAVYDQPSHDSINKAVEWYASSLGTLRHAIDTATVWLKTPILFETSEEQRENVEELINRISLGLPAIAIYKESIDLDGIRITQTNITPSVLSALHESYNKILAMMFEEIGIPDVNQTKMAQQTTNEILLPTLPTSLKTLARLRMRREWALRVNEVLGTTITVEAVSLSLIEQSITSRSGIPVHLDTNNNGIPDIEEGL